MLDGLITAVVVIDATGKAVFAGRALAGHKDRRPTRASR